LNIVENEWEAGFVKLRLYLGQVNQNYGVKDHNWGKNPEIKRSTKKILMCNLFQCRDLSPSDYNGSADPYVKFKLSGFSAQTKAGDKLVTLNP